MSSETPIYDATCREVGPPDDGADPGPGPDDDPVTRDLALPDSGAPSSRGAGR